MTRPCVSMGSVPRIWTLRVTLACIVMVPLLATQSAVAQERYEDGTFEVDQEGVLTNWTINGPFFRPQEAQGADVGASAPRTGGNPGAFLRSQVTSVPVPAGESWVVWGIFINDQAVYDPGSLGAIERVDFDFDSRLPEGTRGSRAVSLAVQQGEFFWAALTPRVFVQDLSWTPMSISGLQASDFILSDIWAQEGQDPTPDFSATGLPVRFGLLQGQSCPTTSDCSAPPTVVEVDTDNWTVTVNNTGLSVELSVAQVFGPGRFPELPLEFAVSARVRNAGTIPLRDIEVRFLLPKEALADFDIPAGECIPDSATLNDAVIADCTIPGPIQPPLQQEDSDTVSVPTSVISVGYANVVPDGSEFLYQAEIVSFSGREPDSNDDLADEVLISICNPSGMDPVVVDDAMTCGDLMTGGTGGDPTMGTDGGGCDCYIASAPGSNPWALPFLCLAAWAIWRRLRRS